MSSLPTASPNPAHDTPIWSGHPSHWHYGWYWFWGLLSAVIIVGIFIIIWIFIDRARRSYIVTPTKIITEWGLFAKSSNEIRIKDVRSINMVKPGLLGIMGIGDLEFSSSASDKAEIVFKTIAHATAVRDLVRQHQEP